MNRLPLALATFLLCAASLVAQNGVKDGGIEYNLRRAERLMDQLNFRFAVTHLEKVGANYPKDARVDVLRGECHFAMSQWKEAIAAYRAGFAKDPGLVPRVSNYPFALLKLGELDEAEKGYEAIFAKAGDDGERAQAAYGVGLVKLNRGDEPGALAAFQRAHGFNPRSSKINYRLGIAYRMAKKPDEALRHLEMVLDRNGLHEAAAYNVAMAWTQKKDAAKVKEWKRRHREIRDARVKLAGFRARLTERPGDALLLRNIAEILLEFGNHDEAVGVWRAVRAQASTDAEVVYKYALCLFHVGDYFASRTQLEQAMRLDPELKEAQALHDRIMAEFHGGERKVEAPGATRVDEDGDS